MRSRMGLACIVALVSLQAGGDLLACGDKYLVASRGTRYHRPKNARAASVVIYAHPSSDFVSARVESALRREGHQIKTANTFEQLSAILSGGRIDVVVAAGEMAARIQELMAGSAVPAAVVAFDARPSASTLLKAIDKSVLQLDQTARGKRTGS